jgi:tRNA pseudouridine55 synthase
MDGILNLNKPAGMTSFGVVARVKRLSGEKHCGHAGTLDPLATGVLPVCLGQATRVIEYLFAETKTYRAEVELGKSTDTYDATGMVTRTADASAVTLTDLEKALAAFRGTILQVPPMYSAVKHQGKPLYELARSGLEVERKSRPAQIFRLEISHWQPPVVTLDIDCGKGTYIRCLANDLGEALGCGANMQSLVRLRVGPFRIEEALTLPELEEAFNKGRGEDQLFPVDHVLLAYNAVVVNHEQQCSLVHGMPVTFTQNPLAGGPEKGMGNLCRAYTQDGSFLGMLKYEKERWLPDKIFLRNCCQQ